MVFAMFLEVAGRVLYDRGERLKDEEHASLSLAEEYSSISSQREISGRSASDLTTRASIKRRLWALGSAQYEASIGSRNFTHSLKDSRKGTVGDSRQQSSTVGDSQRQSQTIADNRRQSVTVADIAKGSCHRRCQAVQTV